ncbi:MAG: hypothetical protein GY869_12535 [Planctomycetes bacterium]|nr:hypothetical protein [Planctomycetota bacterium]
MALGANADATNDYTLATGTGTTASGPYSTAMGVDITVSGNRSFGIGLGGASTTVSANNVMSIMGGNVGIGQTNPSEKLQVNGAVAADKIVYNSPRYETISYGGEGFNPSSNVNYLNSPHGVYLISGSGELVCPIHLPQDAVITELTAYFKDNSTSDMTLNLMRLSLDGNGIGNIGQADSSGISGLGSDTIVLDHTVDNTTRSYYLGAHSFAWDSSNMKLTGVTITYRINEIR